MSDWLGKAAFLGVTPYDGVVLDEAYVPTLQGLRTATVLGGPETFESDSSYIETLQSRSNSAAEISE